VRGVESHIRLAYFADDGRDEAHREDDVDHPEYQSRAVDVWGKVSEADGGDGDDVVVEGIEEGEVQLELKDLRDDARKRCAEGER
jgi:hypothetical protein